MHLLVPSAFRHYRVMIGAEFSASQCTFWCPVLSDPAQTGFPSPSITVSMHLLVPSAFRPKVGASERYQLVSMHLLVPSAFRLDELVLAGVLYKVSMHLLVPSAFRLRPQKTAPQRRLPKRNRRRPGKHHIESARTCLIKPHNREKPPQTTPAPPTPPTHWYATGFQRTQAKKPTPHDYARVNFVLLGIQNPLLQSDAYFASGITDTGLH